MQEQEINLIDYIKVILKRKKLVFMVFLVVIVMVGAYSFLMPKVYRVDSVLEIGKLNGKERTLEDLNQLAQKIKLEYPQVSVENPKETNLLVIEIHSSDPWQAKAILQEINNKVLQVHQKKFNAEKEIFEQEITRIENKVNSLKQEEKNLQAKIDALEKTAVYYHTPGSQFALYSAKEKLEKKKQEIEDLYSEINSLKASLQEIKPTQIVKQPSISDKPIKPKWLLNIAFAIVLGLFLGIFLAFLQEWWEKGFRSQPNI